MDLAKEFLRGVIVKAVMAKAISALPFLAFPILNPLFGMLLNWIIGMAVSDAVDAVHMHAIAVKNILNRKAFDDEWIKISILAKNPLSEEQKIVALKDAKQKFADFVRTPVAV